MICTVSSLALAKINKIHASPQNMRGLPTTSEDVKVYKIFDRFIEQEWSAIQKNDSFYQDYKPTMPLALFDTRSTCNGKRIYYFNFADLKIENSKKEHIFYSGYTGSGGSRTLLFTTDLNKLTFTILFDETTLAFAGFENQRNCPQAYFKMHDNKHPSHDPQVGITTFTFSTDQHYRKIHRLDSPTKSQRQK